MVNHRSSLPLLECHIRRTLRCVPSFSIVVSTVWRPPSFLSSRFPVASFDCGKHHSESAFVRRRRRYLSSFRHLFGDNSASLLPVGHFSDIVRSASRRGTSRPSLSLSSLSSSSSSSLSSCPSLPQPDTLRAPFSSSSWSWSSSSSLSLCAVLRRTSRRTTMTLPLSSPLPSSISATSTNTTTTTVTTTITSKAARSISSSSSSNGATSSSASCAAAEMTTTTTHASESTDTSKHYQSHTSDSYESAYFYSPGEYTSHLAMLVKDALGLSLVHKGNRGGGGRGNQDDKEPDGTDGQADYPTKTTALASASASASPDALPSSTPKRRRNVVLLDIGGGTGNFTRMLLSDEGENSNMAEAIVVDPFLGQGDTTHDGHDDDDENENDDDGDGIGNNGKGCKENQGERVRFVKASAEDYASPPLVTSLSSLHADADANADANSVPFAEHWWRRGYHQVLMKEVVHHIRPEDRIGVFRGLLEGTAAFDDDDDDDDDDDNDDKDKNVDKPLSSSSSSYSSSSSSSLTLPTPTLKTPTKPPSILIITRPQRDIDYPLWPEAIDVWANNQPSAHDIISDLTKAGYVDVRVVMHPYPCEIQLERWIRMVRNRFWSTFANFTNEELDVACAWIRSEMKRKSRMERNGEGGDCESVGDDGNKVDGVADDDDDDDDNDEKTLRFEDRLLFITGHRRE